MSHSVDQHLERHLGPIRRGWAPVGESDVQVCLFENCPVIGTVTYATLGLSRHVLDMPRDREVRQELLLSVATAFASDDMAKMLAYVADRLLRDHHALLRGQVVPLGHPIVPASSCKSLYVALPVAFPDDLATCSDTQPPTVFAWLIPIHAAEAELVSRLGWSDFEDRLERIDPDLFDLERRSIA